MDNEYAEAPTKNLPVVQQDVDYDRMYRVLKTSAERQIAQEIIDRISTDIDDIDREMDGLRDQTSNLLERKARLDSRRAQLVEERLKQRQLVRDSEDAER